MATTLDADNRHYLPPGTLVVVARNVTTNPHSVVLDTEGEVIKTVLSDGLYWHRLLLNTSEVWVRVEDVDPALKEEEVEAAMKSIRRSFARPLTRYEKPGASDGNGGPHPLAGVPQEVLDATTKALHEALIDYDQIEYDEIESMAHAVLLAAINAAKEW